MNESELKVWLESVKRRTELRRKMFLLECPIAFPYESNIEAFKQACQEQRS